MITLEKLNKMTDSEREVLYAKKDLLDYIGLVLFIILIATVGYFALFFVKWLLSLLFG